MLFLRDTGCRASESIGLRWGQIDLERRIARLQESKTNTERWLFFIEPTAQALATYRKTVPHKPDDPVWWGEQGPLTYSGLYGVFKRLAKKSGVSRFNPHSWRHAYGRDASLAGMPTTVLQDVLGHEDLNQTAHYSRFDVTRLQTAHDRYSPLRADLTAVDGPVVLPALLK